MSYCTQAEIETRIPAPHLNDALDDDRDGTADEGVLTAIIASADNAVDAYLAGLYDVPIAPAPAPCKEASLIFACEAIYDRRQIVERNPFTARANFWRQRLQDIGDGKLPLDAATVKTFTPGAAVTEDARIDGSMA